MPVGLNWAVSGNSLPIPADDPAQTRCLIFRAQSKSSIAWTDCGGPLRVIQGGKGQGGDSIQGEEGAVEDPPLLFSVQKIACKSKSLWQEIPPCVFGSTVYTPYISRKQYAN